MTSVGQSGEGLQRPEGVDQATMVLRRELIGCPLHDARALGPDLGVEPAAGSRDLEDRRTAVRRVR